MRKQWIVGAASATLFGALAVAANAAPASNAVGVPLSMERASVVEQAARRCWWRNGRRRCGEVSRRSRGNSGGYGVNYGRARPEEFRAGSTSWWRAMDEEGRGGHGNLP